MLLIRPFLALLALTPAAAQYMIIGEPTKLDSGMEKGKDSSEVDTPERALTNAERMQQGLHPGFPKQLSGVLESRARRRDQGRTWSPQRRAPACQSGAPIVFPPAPQQVNPTVLYTGANGNWDDYNTQVTLSFPVVIFGVSSPTIYVSTNGLISFSGTSSYTNDALYSTTINSPAVLPFWDDLYVLSGTPNKITVASSATDFSVRWQVTTFNDRGTASGNDLDFTLYYSTATPGRFYAYYDVTSSRIGASSGNSATIGAQGDSTAKPFTQYSINMSGAVSAGTKIAFDTACMGSWTKG